MMNKQELRKIMLQRRREITEEEQIRTSAVICGRLAEILKDYPDGAVMSYLAYGREVDLSDLHRELWRQGRRLVVPRTADLPSGIMQAVEYLPSSRLIKTGLGVVEPEGAAMVSPQEIGVVIVPGVAFDKSGARLGHGMGYYDRYLAGLNNVAVLGVCYACQLVEQVPTDEFDRPMDMVIYE